MVTERLGGSPHPEDTAAAAFENIIMNVRSLPPVIGAGVDKRRSSHEQGAALILIGAARDIYGIRSDHVQLEIVAPGVIQAGHENLRLIFLHNIIAEIDGLEKFDFQVGRAFLIVYDHHVATGNDAGVAGYRTIVIEVSYPCRPAVVVPRLIAGEIKLGTDSDVAEAIARIPDPYAELRAAGVGRACLVQSNIIVVIRPILNRCFERLGPVRKAPDTP